MLHAFRGGKDGVVPQGTLVFDQAGSLYGVTLGGGAYGDGTVFKLMRSGGIWKKSVLHQFKGGKDGNTDIWWRQWGLRKSVGAAGLRHGLQADPEWKGGMVRASGSSLRRQRGKQSPRTDSAGRGGQAVFDDKQQWQYQRPRSRV